jgi:predicted metallo-beta-lactamase superfamily hydrolase
MKLKKSKMVLSSYMAFRHFDMKEMYNDTQNTEAKVFYGKRMLLLSSRGHRSCSAANKRFHRYCMDEPDCLDDAD